MESTLTCAVAGPDSYVGAVGCIPKPREAEGENRASSALGVAWRKGNLLAILFLQRQYLQSQAERVVDGYGTCTLKAKEEFGQEKAQV